MKFSWDRLEKPFTVLASMEGVTDTVLRQCIALIHKPDVMFTEFVSVEGMNSAGRTEMLSKLKFEDIERPIVAQLWGVTPDLFYHSAKDVAAMGFDAIDINMGCPDKNVMKMGGGAALIENPDLAGRIIKAVRDGITASGLSLPVSVKTRIGISRKITETWAGFLLSHEPDALTIHGLTAREQYKKPADWNEIRKVVDIGKKTGSKTVIIGNGNVMSYQDAIDRHTTYGVKGIMIGRGVFQNCHCFDRGSGSVTQPELFREFERHLKLFNKTYGSQYQKYVTMKKFFRMYIRDFEGSVLIRDRLMKTKSVSDAIEVLVALRTKNAVKAR